MKNRGGGRNSYAKSWRQKTTLFFQTWRRVGGQTSADSALVIGVSDGLGVGEEDLYRGFIQMCSDVFSKWAPSSPKAWFTVFTNLGDVNTPTVAHVKPLIWHHWVGCGEEMCRIGPPRSSGTISQLFDVMVNFMCQLGCVMMPRYLFKEDSVCVGAFARMPAQSLQSCPTLWNLMDCNPPGFSVHGILQARILEQVAMPSSRAPSQPRDWIHISSTSYIDRQVLYHWMLLDKINLWLI